MREIKKIIIHCTDSDIEAHHNVETITEWHKAKRFKTIGYQYLVTKTAVEVGRPLEMVGAHCKRNNKNSIGIAVCGKTEFSKLQFKLLADLVWELIEEFGLTLDDVYPHNHFNSGKTCPNFDIEYEIKRRIHARQRHQPQESVQEQCEETPSDGIDIGLRR